MSETSGNETSDDQTSDNDVRHEGSSFDPVSRDPGAPVSPDYPPEAVPDKVGDLPDAEVPGEQTDPDRRLTGGEQPVESGSTSSEKVTPGTMEPPD